MYDSLSFYLLRISNWAAKVIPLILTHNMKPVFDQNKIAELKQLISNKQEIVITTHHKPDGDALGSSLGLAAFFRAIGHSVNVVVPSEFPDFLSWMKGSNEVVDFLRDSAKAKELFKKATFVCCLDFNDPRRVEALHDTLVNAPGLKLMLDHHLDPKDFCHFTFSDPKVGSTCELVYHLIDALNGTLLIDKDSAACLYAGIMTDTGSFRFNSVTPTTHRVIANLLETGMRNDFVHEAIYDTSSESRLRFLGNSLLNQMTVKPEFNTVFFEATKEDMQRFKHQSGDLEGIVNYGLSIKGIKMAALFSERDGIVKISFRSKGDFSVKALAEKHFEGGGHKNAAGGRSSLSLKDTIAKFVALLPSYLEDLSK
jgi:phosphoesterase RecJ-like protein